MSEASVLGIPGGQPRRMIFNLAVTTNKKPRHLSVAGFVIGGAGGS